jgi:hypothetical protein
VPSIQKRHSGILWRLFGGSVKANANLFLVNAISYVELSLFSPFQSRFARFQARETGPDVKIVYLIRKAYQSGR